MHKVVIWLACVIQLVWANNVVVLTDSDFEHLTQASTGATTGDWFIGHCKRLEPAWEELADTLKGEINVAKVNARENRNLAKRFNIKAYPTLILFHQGEMYQFKGKRDVESLATFARVGYFQNRRVSRANITVQSGYESGTKLGAVPKDLGLIESLLADMKQHLTAAVIQLNARDKKVRNASRIILLVGTIMGAILGAIATNLFILAASLLQVRRPQPRKTTKAAEKADKED